MRGSAVGDVVKIWVWVVVSLIVGLWLTPVVFNGGKAMAELSGSKDFNGVLNKFAAWSGAAGLKDFFIICWPLAALLLLFPLIEWLAPTSKEGGESRSNVLLPHHGDIGDDAGEPIEPNRWRPLQGLAGFALTFGVFFLIGLAMVKTGFLVLKTDGWEHSLWFDAGWTLAVAILIEVFFRCVLLGVFFRAMKPLAAIALAAFLFGGILFILSGFRGEADVDGETVAVFQLAAMLFAGGDFFPRFVIVFLPWFAFGCVLGWARWRTASLWLSGGLLAGWLMVDRFFTHVTKTGALPDEWTTYFAAESVHNGIISLLGVVVVGGFVYVFTNGYSSKRSADD